MPTERSFGEVIPTGVDTSHQGIDVLRSDVDFQRWEWYWESARLSFIYGDVHCSENVVEISVLWTFRG